MASVNCDAQRARYQAYWRDYPTGSVVLGGNSETKYNPACNQFVFSNQAFVFGNRFPESRVA